MNKILQSTRNKLILLVIFLLIFSACATLTGGSNNPENVAPAPPIQDPAPANVEPIEPAEEVEPAEEQPAPQPPEPAPQPTNTPEPPPPPTEEPEPDVELNTSRLVSELSLIMLRPEDLNTVYIMQNDKPVDNDRVIKQMAWADGREYNQVTDRITGWNTYMERAQNEFAPYSFRTRLEVFKTIEGAKTAFTGDWLFIFNDPNIKVSEFLSLECQYGQQCLVAYYAEEIPGTSDVNVEYHLVFRYHNVGVYVFAKGLEGAVTVETVEEVGQLIIDRLAQYQ